MRIVTERTLVKSVVERWTAQYPHDCLLDGGGSSLQILNQLKLLDLDRATPRHIEDIIGNNSWTNELCLECGERHSYGVVIGDTNTFICLGCMGVVADKWCVLKELVEGGF